MSMLSASQLHPRPAAFCWLSRWGNGPAAAQALKARFARYTDRWWEVKQEKARAAAERAAREEKEREAKALENYHGLRWILRISRVDLGQLTEEKA